MQYRMCMPMGAYTYACTYAHIAHAARIHVYPHHTHAAYRDLAYARRCMHVPVSSTQSVCVYACMRVCVYACMHVFASLHIGARLCVRRGTGRHLPVRPGIPVQYTFRIVYLQTCRPDDPKTCAVPCARLSVHCTRCAFIRYHIRRRPRDHAYACARARTCAC
jgi:hypothetical protein